MAQWVIDTEIDLAKGKSAGARQQSIQPLAYPGNAAAHGWRVTVRENGYPYIMSNHTITAYFQRADGNTVLVQGTANGNVAQVVFPGEVYAVPGVVHGIINATVSGQSTTALDAVSFTVRPNLTGNIIDPGSVIPASIDDMLAIIGDAQEAATNAANATKYIADTYDATKNYAVDDYVINNGKLYRFTADHEAGAWIGTDAMEIQMTNDVRELKSAFDDIKDITITTEYSWSNIPLTVQTDGYYNTSGAFIENTSRQYATMNDVLPTDVYKLSTHIRPTTIPAILFFNNDTFISYIKAGSGSDEDLVDYEFEIPSGVNKLIVQSSERPSIVTMSLSLRSTEISNKAYTKPESVKIFNGKYGLRWMLTNPDDLGKRVFAAEKLEARIGVGQIDGYSDFDNIYPWSEMKRCNIKQNANGASIVTFEGETDFTLDGSNGDVFVRIPKFGIEHYIRDGYEYIVISANGSETHPAFIENGREIDEIFIGAFEGYSDGVKLHSYGGVIPSSNIAGNDLLALAVENGNNYSLYDMRCVSALWCLMTVEFGCRNTNQIFGYGFSDFLQPVTGANGVTCDKAETTNVFSAPISTSSSRINQLLVGSNCTICKGTQQNVIASRTITAKSSDSSHYYITFDGDPVVLDTTCFIGGAACTTNFCETAPSGALNWHTGRANWVQNSNTKNPIRYRWIENVVGSLWHLLPDITFNECQMYQCKNMTSYHFGDISGDYKPVGKLYTKQDSNGSKADITDANYWIDSLSRNYFAKGVEFGSSWDTSLISNQAFGAYYYLSDGLRIIANGGGFDHLYRCNVLTNRAWLSPNDAWYLYGARLMYKNLD